ncbi:unnamed protein product [Owenia fusiformis]|uniref:P2X purinoreceptor 7 intracellular domain-containing protein n=1 Tax=Owenia fusiformis TaxID=6347 RepID=A0A8J1U9J9_OWEFU|nr:unnamed protein product [Owenia fusiformis]
MASLENNSVQNDAYLNIDEMDDYYLSRQSSQDVSDSTDSEEESDTFALNVPGVVQVQPYIHDPPAPDHHVGPVDVLTINDPDYRNRLEDWCECDLHCTILPNPIERECCVESPSAMEKLDKEVLRGTTTERRRCITRHSGFRGVCMDRDVLETAWGRYKSQYPDGYEGPDHKKMRHIAYRQYQQWIHGHLGRHVRIIIPSCCVSLIRETFPAPELDPVYTGFQQYDQEDQMD